MIRGNLPLLASLLSAAPIATSSKPSVVVYNGGIGDNYDDSNYVGDDTGAYAVVEEGQDTAAHPSYSIGTPSGGMLLSGDGYGDGEGRAWANLFDKSNRLRWSWHSKHSEFDALLGAVALPDESVVLGGTRSVSGRWELLLVNLNQDGEEQWATTLVLNAPDSTCSKCWSAIYWMDMDPDKELLILGGVVDHQPGADTFAWKSGGGQPDAGGIPFVAALPFSKLASAPTKADIQTAHYFDKSPGYTTVVSLRTEHGKGVVALLPLNPIGGAVAHLTYDDSGNFQKEWLKPLSLQNQVTDIAIVGDNANADAYVVSATVNPGAKMEAVTPNGSSSWIHNYNIGSIYPSGKRNWCQECWSIATHGEDIMLSCGVAELNAGDTNCDNGVWRSLLVNLNFKSPTDAKYHLFHASPDENFAVEYASFGKSGEMVCAIDADSGGSVVRVAAATSSAVVV